MPSINTANWDAKLTVTETVELQTKTHRILGTPDKFTPTSTPAAKEVFSDTRTLGVSDDAIDLGSLPDSAITADKQRMRTLKVRLVKISNPSTNSGAITLKEGLTTAYPILGASGLVVIPVGGTLLVNHESGAGVIGNSANVAVAGTEDDVYSIIIVAG